MYNREIISYCISLSPNLQRVRDMLTGLIAKLPETARPVLLSDQGGSTNTQNTRGSCRTQHDTVYDQKGNCMDNGAAESFFGRLKVEMFYREQFESAEDFIHALNDCIYYYNNDRISLK